MKSYFDLIIVSREPFPEGMAATNRIKAYASYIAKEKKVLFLTTSGPEYFVKDPAPKSGTYNNISYQYIGDKELTGKPSAFLRFLYIIRRQTLLILLLLFRYRCRSLLLVSRSSLLMIVLKLVTCIMRTRFYRETSETPLKTSNILKKNYFIYIHKIFDGIIVISQNMRCYYSSIKDDSKFFVLPVMVDHTKFNDYKKVKKEPFFFYCSGSNLERDGFLDSIRAFVEFRKTNKDYRLLIATQLDLNLDYHRKVKDIIDNNNDSIEYLGRISHEEISQYLMKASALLLTPHHNYETKGFPTKLAEYLISGTPVICSSIDDLKCEIDDSCVYTTQPNDISEIASAMAAIIKDSRKAKEVGERGRKLAFNKFTMEGYRKSIIEFLKI